MTANCGLCTNVYLFAYCLSNFLCEMPTNIWTCQTWAAFSWSAPDQKAVLCRSVAASKCLHTSVLFGQCYVQISYFSCCGPISIPGQWPVKPIVFNTIFPYVKTTIIGRLHNSPNILCVCVWDVIKEGETGGVLGTHGEERTRIECFGGKTRNKEKVWKTSA